MIALPIALVAPAVEAGIKVPDDPDNYDLEEFPHFHVYCCMQLGTPMPSPSSHWTNAKVVAQVPNDRIKLVTPKDLEELGFQRGFPLV